MDESRKLDRTWLCSIVFSDIVNYSSQSVELQMKWKRYFNEVLGEALKSVPPDDRIVLDTGDGAAVCFVGEPEVALFSTLSMRSAFADQAAKDNTSPRVRLGINLGPVKMCRDINGNLNALGDGINVAQRVMSFAAPNQILVSQSFFEVVSRISDDYKPLFRYDSVRNDKHIREHVVYELHPARPGTSTAGTQTGVEERLPYGADKAGPHESDVVAPAAGVSGRSRRKLLTLGISSVVAIALIAWLLFHPRRAAAIGEKDTVVLADFVNRTGDSVFEDTLRQALAVQLQQSPFLNILSDRKAAATLRQMGRSLDQPVTGETARQLCQRVGGTALLAGSIAALGSKYVIGLNAVDCNSGDTLVQEQIQARDKEDVLNVLNQAATQMRGKLGESLSSVQKFATPIEEATTSSLEALKAYSVAHKMWLEKGDAAALAPMKHVIELDPKFALAHSALAVTYGNLGAGKRAGEAAAKAYELRDRVTERERYRIIALYYMLVTGDLERANQTYEVWKQSYPRDYVPYFDLVYDYMGMGQWEKALPEQQKALSLEPNALVGMVNEVQINLALNHIEAAQTRLAEAQKRGIDAVGIRLAIYQTSFLRNDEPSMRQQLASGAGRAGEEDMLLSAQADVEAYHGRLTKFRDFSHRAVESAVRAESKETAAQWQAEAALYESAFGNAGIAAQNAAAALRLEPGRDVRTLAALAFAQSGAVAQAQKLADGLDKEFPQNTILQGYWLPSIRAAVAVNTRNGSKAVELLQRAATYELGQSILPYGLLYPVYLRGQAYLLLRRGSEAAAEFRKIIDQRGIVLYCPLGALAHVGLARAYALQGDTARARASYESFFALWKEGDGDIPIMRQARAEFAQLR